jgi:type VI secretion system protein ImpH
MKEELPTIVDELTEKLPEVSFFQLLRCIQVARKCRIGMEKRIDRQPVRMVCDTEMNFPFSELSDWRRSEDSLDPRPTLVNTFFGLYGSHGVLPEHYTYRIHTQWKEFGDSTLREFLDLFNHRLYSLFYLSWEKNCFPVAFETAKFAGQDDPITQIRRALIGNRMEAGSDRLSFPEDHLLYYSGHFAATSRPAAASLRIAAMDFTGLPVDVRQFVGCWLYLKPEDQSRLGGFGLGQSSGNLLGQDAVAGERVWDWENRFELDVGPVAWEEFQEWLPGSIRLRKLHDFVRRMVGPQFDFSITLLVQPNQVRTLSLDSSKPTALGWSTWLGEWTSTEPARDAEFQLEDFATRPI